MEAVAIASPDDYVLAQGMGVADVLYFIYKLGCSLSLCQFKTKPLGNLNNKP